MRKLLKKSVGAILLGAMILSSSTAALAAEDAPVVQIQATTRAMRLNYQPLQIAYNSFAKLTRETGYLEALPTLDKNFTINPGVPVELGFNISLEEQYVRISFVDIDTSETTELFVGATKDFKIARTFSKRMHGYFKIENWSNGTLVLKNLYVAY